MKLDRRFLSAPWACEYIDQRATAVTCNDAPGQLEQTALRAVSSNNNEGCAAGIVCVDMLGYLWSIGAKIKEWNSENQ